MAQTSTCCWSLNNVRGLLMVENQSQEEEARDHMEKVFGMGCHKLRKGKLASMQGESW